MHEENIGSMIAQVARLMRRSFDERVRETGATRPQWQVLNLLSRYEGINQGGLAEMLEVEPITLGRMIDRLQDAELVERRADPADRRAWRLHVTAKGNALISALRPYGQETLEQALEGIDATRRADLMAMLVRIRGNLSRKDSPDPAQAAPPQPESGA